MTVARIAHFTVTVGACLHGGGVPQIGEVTCGGSPQLSCKRGQIKRRDYMDRRVTSPTWGPPPPCNQALGNKARVDLVLIQPCLLYYVNHVFVILNSIFQAKFTSEKEGSLYQNKVTLSLTFTQRLGHQTLFRHSRKKQDTIAKRFSLVLPSHNYSVHSCLS